jgi:adenylate cyclase
VATDREPARGRVARAAEAARRLDRHPGVVGAIQRARRRLPGDSAFGDVLSTAGSGTISSVAGRAIGELAPDRPGVLKEVGLGALQVWQALLERSGRGRGDVPMTIVFTDLVGFSSWTVRAGDDAALRMVRRMSETLEAAVRQHKGEVVKRLGDGHMLVFAEPATALAAVFAAKAGLADVEVAGYRPVLRAGMHTGTPRRIGGDYLGVDVNVAARVTERAGAGEVLVSDATLAALGTADLVVRRKIGFTRAKGVPADLRMYAVSPRAVV